MAVTGQNIVDKVHALLSDVNVYWTDPELLGWINSGMKEIALLKPNALVTVASVQCVAGTKQALPAGGLMLVDIIRNMGTAGTTPGRAIVPILRQTLDASNPDWHTSTAAATAKSFAFDPRFPKVFYVYPPQPVSGMGYIEMAYGICPTALAGLAGSIGLDDIYENILIDYVAYRAYAKDSTEASNAAMSKTHYAAFVAALGAKVQSEAAIQPMSPVKPASPPAQVAA